MQEVVGENASIEKMPVWWTKRGTVPASWLAIFTLSAGLVWWADTFLVFMAFLVLMVVSAFSAYRSWAPTRTQATLSIDDRGVHLDGALVAARHSIGLAWQPVAAAPNRVRIASGGSQRYLDVEAADEASATRILIALGDEGVRQVAAYEGTSPVYGEQMTIIIAAIVGTYASHVLPIPMLVTMPWIGTSLCIIVASRLIQLIMRVRVEVGSDGLLLVRRRGQRFISYAEVNRVIEAKGKLTIDLHAGPPVAIRFPYAHQVVETADELRARILQAMKGRVFSGGGGESDAVLARGGREVKTWMQATAALTDGDGDRYRVAGLVPDALWEKVEDVSAEPMARIGAALALRPTLDPDGRERLRVVSMEIARPEVRRALSSIADAEDDVALEATLAQIDDQEMRFR